MSYYLKDLTQTEATTLSAGGLAIFFPPDVRPTDWLGSFLWQVIEHPTESKWAVFINPDRLEVHAQTMSGETSVETFNNFYNALNATIADKAQALTTLTTAQGNVLVEELLPSALINNKANRAELEAANWFPTQGT